MTDTNSFHHADLQIRQLLDSLKAQGVCGCCVAHALLFHGVRQYEQTVRRSDVAEFVQEIAASLHDADISMFALNLGSQH